VADTRGYLDHNATSPLRPEVSAAMVEAFSAWANPSSVHRRGAEARYLLEKARRRIARALNAGDPESLLFTSGATEANNLVLSGFFSPGQKALLIVPTAEHRAVLDCARALARRGSVELVELDVDAEGRAVPVREVPPTRPALLSAMVANNEVGSLNPVADIAGWCSAAGVFFHTDAVQALGRVPLDLQRTGAHFVTLTSHKVGGPKGVGLLWRSPDAPALHPLTYGGAQEAGLRPGTESVPLAVGLATAVEIAVREQAEFADRSARQIARLWDLLQAGCPGIERNSPAESCLPNTLNVALQGRPSQELVRDLDRAGFAVSAGSACTSGGGESPSHVLIAMGLSKDRASSSLRISIGPTTTDDEIEAFSHALCALAP